MTLYMNHSNDTEVCVSVLIVLSHKIHYLETLVLFHSYVAAQNYQYVKESVLLHSAFSFDDNDIDHIEIQQRRRSLKSQQKL